jgi:S-formylglutathione hydrolase
MQKIESHKCHGGVLEVWSHKSFALKCMMQFSIFMPPQANDAPCPAVTFLSGLTCTHENFTNKANAYQIASDLGLIILAPGTSPRGDGVPDDEKSYDFGKGAGFYINATQSPWVKNYQMESYIADELYNLLPHHFPIQKDKQSIMGHSMGGHGALTLYFKYPNQYQSVSALSPIVAPSKVPWGQKAFDGYLGSDISTWKNHDACELVQLSKNKNTEILIDQGLSDNFLTDQLKPELFQRACEKFDQKLSLRTHKGYDHSYFFIQSFINDHLTHHAKNLF